MVQPPDISAFAELLSPIDIQGPERYLYSYNDEGAHNQVRDFLVELEAKAHARYMKYLSAFRMVAQTGRAPWDKWHPLDPKSPPHGVLKDEKGNKISLDGIGEFKNIGHKSRIFHCMEPGGLYVLLTVHTGKNENDLTADSVNPALKMRIEYVRRKGQLLIARRDRIR